MLECGLSASLHRAFGRDQQEQDDTETEIVHVSPGAMGLGKRTSTNVKVMRLRANHPLTMHIEAAGESGSIRDECG